MPAMSDFNILIVAQRGRLAAEAILLAASLRAASPDFSGRLIVAEPQPGPLWRDDPRIGDADSYAALDRLGAEILPFEAQVFGDAYPNGNKIEALAQMPDAPFLFFDSDTLITGELASLDIDFSRPTASMRRTGTWPEPDLYGPEMSEIWSSLYTALSLDFESSLDQTQPEEHWERFLYFNAGWFLGTDPKDFARRMLGVMAMVRDTPPKELAGQAIYPWLDQIALPLVIHTLGGGRPSPALDGLDGAISLHYRALPLLYATAPTETVAFLEDIVQPNWIKKPLKSYKPFHRMLYRGDGAKVRDMFTPMQPDLPEEKIRKRLKRNGLWLR